MHQALEIAASNATTPKIKALVLRKTVEIENNPMRSIWLVVSKYIPELPDCPQLKSDISLNFKLMMGIIQEMNVKVGGVLRVIAMSIVMMIAMLILMKLQLKFILC